MKLIAVDDDIYRLPCGIHVGCGLGWVLHHQIMVGLLSSLRQTAAILTWSESQRRYRGITLTAWSRQLLRCRLMVFILTESTLALGGLREEIGLVALDQAHTSGKRLSI